MFVISECPPTDWTDAKEDELVELETIAAREWVKGIVVDETEVAGCKKKNKNTVEKFLCVGFQQNVLFRGLIENVYILY